jgi:hypothetical protein
MISFRSRKYVQGVFSIFFQKPSNSDRGHLGDLFYYYYYGELVAGRSLPTIMGSSGIISGIIWDLLSGIMWDCLRLFKIIWDLESFRMRLSGLAVGGPGDLSEEPWGALGGALRLWGSWQVLDAKIAILSKLKRKSSIKIAIYVLRVGVTKPCK